MILRSPPPKHSTACYSLNSKHTHTYMISKTPHVQTSTEKEYTHYTHGKGHTPQIHIIASQSIQVQPFTYTCKQEASSHLENKLKFELGSGGTPPLKMAHNSKSGRSRRCHYIHRQARRNILTWGANKSLNRAAKERLPSKIHITASQGG